MFDLSKFAGNRTYVIAAAIAFVSGILAANAQLQFLSPEFVNTLQYILVTLGAGGAASLRASVSDVKATAAETRNALVLTAEAIQQEERPGGGVGMGPQNN